jgi:signal peptidase I
MAEETPNANPAPQKVEHIAPRVSAVVTWMRDLVISLIVAAFIIVFLYQPVKVEGTSMLPGLEDQERIFINKFVYRIEPIQRGDIVVFRYPRDPQKSFIKRVVGIAGDRVRIVEGRVYVNDKML